MWLPRHHPGYQQQLDELGGSWPFERLDVTPVNFLATAQILEDSVPSIESESQTFFTVRLSDYSFKRPLSSRSPFPKKP